MLGVIHIDHAPEELQKLGWEVRNTGCSTSRGKELGVVACFADIGIFGDSPVAIARGDIESEVGLLEKGHGSLATHRLKRRFSFCPSALPEFRIG